MANLSELIDQLGHEIVKLPLGDQRTALVSLQEKLSDQLDELVEKNVGAATPKYQAATAKLAAANQALVAAHQDVQQVAATITQIAQVVDLLAQLASSVR